MSGATLSPPRSGSSVVDEYLRRLDAIHLTGVEVILERGKLLIEARERLNHGEWQTFCAGLPFTSRHAHRLRAIAAHPVLSNRTCMSDLPDGVSILAALARLDAELVLTAITAGQIHPRMTLADARALGGGGAPAKRAWTVASAIERILRLCTPAPPTDRPALAAGLQAIVDSLVGASSTARPDREVVLAVITTGLRAETMKHHPDQAGGDTERMSAINAAGDWLRARARELGR